MARRWYRVELTQEGKRVRCVECPGVNSGRVYYVRAKGVDEAGKLAYNRYAADITKKRRDAYKAQGRCPCGRGRHAEDVQYNGKPFLHCRVCRERKEEHRERYKRRKAGEDVPAGPRLERSATRTRNRRNEITLETLLNVRAAWERSSNIGQFTAWLRAAIAQARSVQKREDS